MNYAALVTAISDYTENTFPTDMMNTFIMQAEQRIYNTVQFPSLRKNVTGAITANNKYISCPNDFLATYSFAIYPAAGGEYTFLLNKDVNFIREAYPDPTATGAPKYYALFGPTVSSGSVTNELSLILGPTPDAIYNTELHYYYYPDTIVPGVMSAISVTNGGTGYTAGYYQNATLTGGSGTNAQANITVSASGVVTSAVITGTNSGYLIGDSLSTSDVGAGSNLVIRPSSITGPNGTTWLGENFDSVLLYGTLIEAYTYMKGEQDMVALYDGKYKEALMLAKRLGDGMERQDAYRSGQYRQQVT